MLILEESMQKNWKDKIFKAEVEQNPPHEHWFSTDGDKICPMCFERFDVPVIPIKNENTKTSD